MKDFASTAILGVLAFAVLLVLGKWHFQHEKYIHERSIESVVPQQYPYNYPQFHDDHHFWDGYKDGYYGRRMFETCDSYRKGYRVGVYDAQSGYCHYWDKHCPSSFRIRFPFIRLEIR